MRLVYWVALWAGVLASSAPAATIDYQVTNLSGNQYRYTYTFSGFTLLTNQAVDLVFDHNLYGVLSNPVVGTGFTFFLAQPDNPPGTNGVFTAEATIDNPPFTGPFSIDFFWLGTGAPGSQPFTIDQFDGSGNLVGGPLDFGVTSVPEPSNLFLSCGGLLLAIGFVIRRRRRHPGHSIPS